MTRRRSSCHGLTKAERELNKLDAARRAGLERGMAAVARDPYGRGTSAARPGYEDCRDTAVGDVMVRYEISKGLLLVTVVRMVPL
ncbi:hypothetical protein [Embleya sp. AB8]|uniref:hypothetical protein n=1 Tax=Embleya sp. AB8 TaxID=3156304 RepID=UPI003C73371D